MRKTLLLISVMLLSGLMDKLSASHNSQDSFPVHYHLLDSIGTNFNLARNLLALTQKELQNPSLHWWNRAVLYDNSFHSAVNLFLPIAEIKQIWAEGYENEPHYTCLHVDIEYARMKDMEYYKNRPLVMHCVLMREKDFFHSRCDAIYAQYDSLLMKELEGMRDIKQYNKKVQFKLDSILEVKGIYPGRSQVGYILESVAWSVLQKADVTTLEKYLPMLKNAVKSKDLHPRYLAAIFDKIEVLKGLPQIYGTQYRVVDGKDEVYPIRDMRSLNDLRGGMGLGKFESNNSSLGDFMENANRD